MLSQAVKECAVFTSKMPPSHVIYPASKVLPFVFNTLNAIVPGDGSEITTTVRNALSYWNRVSAAKFTSKNATSRNTGHGFVHCSG